MDQIYIPLKDVAERLGVHVETLKRAVYRGELDAWDIGEFKTTQEGLQRYLDLKKVQPKEQIPA
jgi:excisionase family DNA binding protein